MPHWHGAGETGRNGWLPEGGIWKWSLSLVVGRSILIGILHQLRSILALVSGLGRIEPDAVRLYFRWRRSATASCHYIQSCGTFRETSGNSECAAWRLEATMMKTIFLWRWLSRSRRSKGKK